MFWRVFILHNEAYTQFCTEFVGGYVDRTEVRENGASSYEKYKLCLKRLESEDEVLKPFYNLWPEYTSANQYELDFQHVCVANKRELWEMIKELKEKIDNEPIKKFKIPYLCLLVDTVARKDIRKTQGSDEYEVYEELEEVVNEDKDITHNLFAPKTDVSVMEFYSTDFLITNPKTLASVIAKERLIGLRAANQWVKEYKKFLTLVAFSKKAVLPSKIVMYVWGVHQGYTRDYREMVNTYFKDIDDFQQLYMRYSDDIGKLKVKVYTTEKRVDPNQGMV